MTDRIAVPDGCPCDFRYSGLPPVCHPCRTCGRNLGSWIACPHAQKLRPPDSHDEASARLNRLLTIAESAVEDEDVETARLAISEALKMLRMPDRQQ